MILYYIGGVKNAQVHTNDRCATTLTFKKMDSWTYIYPLQINVTHSRKIVISIISRPKNS